MEKEFLTCLRAIAKVVQHQWYSNKTEQLKTPQGIFELFVGCLLDQSVNPEHHFRVVNELKRSGWLNYEKLHRLLKTNPSKLRRDLKRALEHYRFPNKATKAIIVNVEKIDHDYNRNLHNLYHLSHKDTSEVWKKVNDLYWFGSKKSGVFIRELVTQGLWQLNLEELPIPPDSRVRRVLWRLGFVKDRNNLKEVENAARELSKDAKITPLDLDCVLWSIGDKGICEEQKTWCGRCPLEEFCPKVISQKEY